MTAEIDAGVQAAAAMSVGRLPAAAVRPDLAGMTAGRQRYLDTATRLIKGRPVVGTIAADGTAVVPLDGPSLGYMWTVRSVTVTDAGSVFAAVPGTAWVFAGVVGGTVLAANNAEWTMPGLPNAATWGSDELVLQYGESLTIAIAAGTPGQAVMVSARYQLYGAPGRRSEVQT